MKKAFCIFLCLILLLTPLTSAFEARFQGASTDAAAGDALIVEGGQLNTQVQQLNSRRNLLELQLEERAGNSASLLNQINSIEAQLRDLELPARELERKAFLFEQANPTFERLAIIQRNTKAVLDGLAMPRTEFTPVPPTAPPPAPAPAAPDPATELLSEGGRLNQQLAALDRQRQRIENLLNSDAGNLTDLSQQLANIDREFEELKASARALEQRTTAFVQANPTTEKMVVLQRNVRDALDRLGLYPQPVGWEAAPQVDVVGSVVTPSEAEALTRMLFEQRKAEYFVTTKRFNQIGEQLLVARGAEVSRVREQLTALGRERFAQFNELVGLADSLGMSQAELVAELNTPRLVPTIEPAELPALTAEREAARVAAKELAEGAKTATEELAAVTQEAVDLMPAAEKTDLLEAVRADDALAGAVDDFGAVGGRDERPPDLEDLERYSESFVEDTWRAEELSGEPIAEGSSFDEAALEEGLSPQKKSFLQKVREKAPQWWASFKQRFVGLRDRARPIRASIREKVSSLTDRLKQIVRLNRHIGTTTPEAAETIEEIVERPTVLEERALEPAPVRGSAGEGLDDWDEIDDLFDDLDYTPLYGEAEPWPEEAAERARPAVTDSESASIRLAELEADLRETQDALAVVKRDIEASFAQRGEVSPFLQRELTALQEQVTTAAEELGRLRASETPYSPEVQQRIAALEERIRAANERMRQLYPDNLQGDIRDYFQQQAAELRTKQAQLEEEIRLEQARQQVALEAEAQARENARVAATEERIEEGAQQAAERAGQVDEASQRLAEDMDAARQETETLRAQREAEAARVDELTEEVARREREPATVDAGEMAARDRAIERLRDDLAAAQQRVQQLDEQLRVARARVDAVEGSISQRVAEVEARLQTQAASGGPPATPSPEPGPTPPAADSAAVRAELQRLQAENAALRTEFENRLAELTRNGGAYNRNITITGNNAPVVVNIESPSATATATGGPSSPVGPQPPPVAHVLTAEEQAALAWAHRDVSTPLFRTELDDILNRYRASLGGGAPPSGPGTPAAAAPAEQPPVPAVENGAQVARVGGPTETPTGGRVREFLFKERHVLPATWRARIGGAYQWASTRWYSPIRWARGIGSGISAVTPGFIKRPLGRVTARLSSPGMRTFGRVVGAVFAGIELGNMLDIAINGESQYSTSPPTFSFTESPLQIQLDPKENFYIELPHDDTSTGKNLIFVNIDSKNNIGVRDWKKSFQEWAQAGGQEGTAKVVQFMSDASLFTTFVDQLDQTGSGSNPFIQGMSVYYFGFDGERWKLAEEPKEVSFDAQRQTFVVPPPSNEQPGETYRYMVTVHFNPMLLAVGASDPENYLLWKNNLLRLCQDRSLPREPGVSTTRTDLKAVLEDSTCPLLSSISVSEDVKQNFATWLKQVEEENEFTRVYANAMKEWGAGVADRFSRGTTDFADWKIHWGIYHYLTGVVWDGVLVGVGTAVFDAPVRGVAADYGFFSVASAQERLVEQINNLRADDYWKLATVYGVPITGQFTVPGGVMESTVVELSLPPVEPSTLTALNGVGFDLGAKDWAFLNAHGVSPLNQKTLLDAMNANGGVVVNDTLTVVEVRSRGPPMDLPFLFIPNAKPGDRLRFVFSFPRGSLLPLHFEKEIIAPSRFIVSDRWFSSTVLPVTPSATTPTPGELHFSRVQSENRSITFTIAAKHVVVDPPQSVVLDLNQIDNRYPLYLVADQASQPMDCTIVENFYNGVLERQVGSSTSAADWGTKWGAWARTKGISIGGTLRDVGSDAWAVTSQAAAGFWIGLTSSNQLSVQGAPVDSGRIPLPSPPPVGSPAAPASTLFENASTVEFRKPLVINPDALKTGKNSWLVQKLENQPLSSLREQSISFTACQLEFNGEHKFALVRNKAAQVILDFGRITCSSILGCLEKVDSQVAQGFR